MVHLSKINHLADFPRDLSSAGLEHYLDKVGVVGSSPTGPTLYEAICILLAVTLTDSLRTARSALCRDGFV